MFAVLRISLRIMGQAALAAAAAAAAIVISGLAFVVTILIAAPLKKLQQP
jgi:hypothetical protein